MAKEIQEPSEEPDKKRCRDRISKLLEDIEAKLGNLASKATLSDFIRLTQLERELEEDEPPREIKITWISPGEKSDIEK